MTELRRKGSSGWRADLRVKLAWWLAAKLVLLALLWFLVSLGGPRCHIDGADTGRHLALDDSQKPCRAGSEEPTVAHRSGRMTSD